MARNPIAYRPRVTPRTGDEAERLPRWAFGASMAVCLACIAACGAQKGDVPPAPATNVLGDGLRLTQVNDPASAARPEDFPGAPWEVSVSGVVVSHVDDFDETKDGRSTGTLYVQDVSSVVPFGGIGTFAVSYPEGDFRAAAGDVVDMTGTYQENPNVGSAVFPEGTFLPQLFRPATTLRYEYVTPEPVDVPLADLETFETGRKWIGMLVRVRDVELADAPRVDRAGRVSVAIFPGEDRNRTTITNELFDLKAGDLVAGARYASVTGIVTFFFNLHLAPRSASDLEAAP